MQRKCLVLFSGGLDSILACKVLQHQGVDVLALKFITPFFSYELKEKDRAEKYMDEVWSKYSIRVRIEDVTHDYLEMLKAPVHGYGRYMNPCIDCKILMIKEAMKLMDDTGASFIATGEVLGQRPMSQRRDTLRIIERDSGADGILLRPLSASFLKETVAEREGLVDRDLLPKIVGRSRKIQMELADSFGIKDYPAPAGGCVLADPILSRRFSTIFETWPEFSHEDCVIAQVGRHFMLDSGGWLVVGRNRSENIRLKNLFRKGDVGLRVIGAPGPFSILRYSESRQEILQASAIVARYVKEKFLPIKVLAKEFDNGTGEEFEIAKRPAQHEIEKMMF